MFLSLLKIQVPGNRISECLLSVSALLWTCSVCPAFFSYALLLSLSPSTPSSLANKSESEGWINKGGKVEHNSPRSVFSGTLTQRKGSTRTNDNTIYIKTLTHINVRPVWLQCADKMRRGDTEGQQSLHAIICMHVGAGGRGGVKKGGDMRKTKGGGRG